jgi:hypothetical protein
MTTEPAPTRPDPGISELEAEYGPPTSHMQEASPVLKRRAQSVRRAVILLVIALAAAVALYVGISSNDTDTVGPGGSTSSADTKLEQAFENAISTGSNFVDISPDGKSLSFHTEGAETTGLSFDKAVGILIYLDAPDSLFARMDNTRALDGTQTATWGDITAYWTYHPDDGLSVVLEER